MGLLGWHLIWFVRSVIQLYANRIEHETSKV